jgi:trimeric autotransporter adhesin
LTLSAAGVISGTPTAAGTSSFTVRVTDSATPTAAIATRALSLTVTPLAAATVLFATQIQPIFTANCTLNCHSPGGLAAFLNLTAGSSYSSLLLSTTPAVIAGSSATSRLYGRVSGAVFPQMPLNAPPLSAANQTLIKNWIDQGAANN